MAITLICPNLRCRSVLQVPDSVRGRPVRCSRCGRNFIVPEAVGASQPKPGPNASPDSAETDTAEPATAS
jgi:hypothetical protein